MVIHKVPVFYEYLLPHHFNEPLFLWVTMLISFSITSQIPRRHDFDSV